MPCGSSKAIDMENDLRGTLRNFGLKVGMVGAARFEARIRELVEGLPDLAVLVEPLLVVRQVLRQQLAVLHRRLLAVVRDDEVCRRLMTTPGVGPLVALTYRTTVDVPAPAGRSWLGGWLFGRIRPTKSRLARATDHRREPRGPSQTGLILDPDGTIVRPPHP
jgi:transposase